MAAVALPPPFEVFCFKDRIYPIRAVDHRGVDVTDGAPPHRPAVRRRDRVWTDGSRASPSRTSSISISATGWRKRRRTPGWSFSSRAPWNTTIRRRPLPQRRRTWTSCAEPPRRARWPLGGIIPRSWLSGRDPAHHDPRLDRQAPATDRKLRIESNMELYWDCIFLGQHVPAQALTQDVAGPHAICTRSATRANTLPTGEADPARLRQRGPIGRLEAHGRGLHAVRRGRRTARRGRRLLRDHGPRGRSHASLSGRGIRSRPARLLPHVPPEDR